MRAGAATGRGVGSCGSRRGGSGRSSLGGRDPRGRTPFRGESAAGHERVCRGGAQPPAGSYSNFFDPRGSIPYGYVAAGVRCSTKAGAHTVAWGERTRPHASGRHLLPRLPPRSTGKAGGYIRTARSPVLLIREDTLPLPPVRHTTHVGAAPPNTTHRRGVVNLELLPYVRKGDGLPRRRPGRCQLVTSPDGGVRSPVRKSEGFRPDAAAAPNRWAVPPRPDSDPESVRGWEGDWR